MPKISRDQKVYCKIAQLEQSLDVFALDKTAFKSILPQIDDVNVKVISDKSKVNLHHLSGATPLHIACYHEHIQAIDALLKRGADLTAKNNKGYTAIHQSFCDMLQKMYRQWKNATSGQFDNAFIKPLLNALVESGSSENSCSADGLSHFHIACASNHLEAVQLFLNGGESSNEAVNVDSKTFPGYTPLHFAAKYYGYETTKLLLEHGADVNAKDVKGLTPLHIAINSSLKLIKWKNDVKWQTENLNEYMEINETIIDLLLKDIRAMDADHTGLSKFHAVCTLSDSSLAESLIKDVDVNCAVNIDSPVCPGYTPLHFAAQFNIEIVELLLKKGAKIKAKDANGITPFDLCVEKYDVKDLFRILSAMPSFKDILFSDSKTRLFDLMNSMRSIETFELFLKSTSRNVYLPNNSLLWPGYYLSHFAVLFSKDDADDIAKRYFDLGGKAMIQNAHGQTPLHLAFYQKKEKIIDLFFERHLGFVDAIDNDGLSHLHIACRRANQIAVRSLLANGVNVNVIYNGKPLASVVTESAYARIIYYGKPLPPVITSGSRPLHVAVANGNINIVKMLLQHGADVNATDADGTTAIHYSLFSCPLDSGKEIADLLFASRDLREVVSRKTGLSHLHVASFFGNDCVVEYLLKFGADVNTVFTCDNYPILDNSLPNLSSSSFPRYTPIHFAVMKKQARIVELLLQADSDILREKTNGTSLFYDVLIHCTLTSDSLRLGGISMKKTLASMVANDAILEKRVRDDTGITLLHIACHLCDVEQIRSLLADSKLDVNAQTFSTSPVWPKVTPLDLLMTSGYYINLENAVKLLLDRGADIMLTNDSGNTPLQTFSYRRQNYGNHNMVYRLLRSLIECHKDFSLNPTNEEGVSHFHVACMASEYTIVEKFLENGVDVNLPIKCRHRSMIFQTPLHLVLRSRIDGLSDTQSQLRTIDVLLKYGADVNAQDEKGWTPLLEVARKGRSRELFFKKFVKAGANVNYKNFKNESLLEILLRSKDPMTIEEFSFFVDNHIHFNIFNASSKSGILTTIMPYEPNNRKLIFERIMQTPSIFVVDQMGRTPIHNIVANEVNIRPLLNCTTISVDEYSNYIEKFIKMGFDIDAQDCAGKTALHVAAHFHNDKAILGLIAAGADVNVTDKNNEPPITQDFQVRYNWQLVGGRITKIPRSTKQDFTLHVISMQLCNLKINDANLILANSLPRDENFRFHREQVLKEIEMTKLANLGTELLTLEDFLSETDAELVFRLSRVSKADREAVEKFFESNDNEIFPKLRGVLKLQYRKVLKRFQLIAATDSLRKTLTTVNGFPMPEVCLRIILRFLTSIELKHLIASTSIED